MRLSSYLPIALAILLAAAASLSAAVVAVDRIERSALAEVRAALAAEGHQWTRVAVDGLQVQLAGTAPDEAARFGALSAAGSIVDSARVIDAMDVRPAQRIAPPEFKVEILRNLDGISLIGLVPATTDRTELLERVGRVTAAGQVTDLLEAGDYPEPEHWAAALEFALEALDGLARAKVSVGAETVAITAITETAQDRDRIVAALERRAPEGIRLALDISAPRPVIAPFTLRFLIDGEGVRFDACSADTAEARAAILDAAREAGLTGAAECEIGLGAPSVRWAEAAVAGIGALERLGGGALTLSDADVSLVALEPMPVAAFDSVVGALERALPAGFTLHAVLPEPPEDDTGTAAGEAEAREFVATLSPEGTVQLRGRVTDAQARAVVDSVAGAHFGAANTTGATRLDPELPVGWTLRVLAALDALARLDRGAVTVRPGTLEVRGDTGNPRASGEISRMLSDRLGDGETYAIEVRYVETLDPAYGLPSPEECVARLNAVLAAKKITFAPGSTEIEGEAVGVIDALAEALTDCQDVRMEIGGHTDSQGRESMNMRLSQARADAVLNAIMARRVLTSNLVARGYGESRPIADNDTEEGREANRRIEFTLVTDEGGDGEAAEGAEAASEAAGEAAGAGEESANEQN